MVYDCFPFFNELELLDIRCNELSGVVDRFVLVEATMTHNGDPKKLYYEENKERFAEFNDKIIHIVVDDFSGAEQGRTFQERAWMRENIQRNAIAIALNHVLDDDIVIVSDIDEIPRASKVRELVGRCGPDEVIGFALAQYNYFLNLRNVSNPIWGNDPKMARVATFRDKSAYRTSPYNHFILKPVNQGLTATRFRYIHPTRRIADAGWHFSYLGGIESAVNKLRAFNEMGLYSKKNIEQFVQRKIAAGRSLWGHDHFMPEPFDGTFPIYVLVNHERFAKLIYQNVPVQGIKEAVLRKWFYVTACVRRLLMRILFWLTPRWVRKMIKKIMGYRF